jgi:hypothetical protein
MEMPQPLSCSLNGDELLDRIDSWREVVQRATSHAVEDDCVVAVYPNDARLLDRLRELIAAEAECCSFLHFSLEETPDAILTQLRLPEELPDSTRSQVVALFG